MNFFDSLINDTLNLISAHKNSSSVFDCGEKWADIGYNEVVLQRDSAFELDGVGFNLITSLPVTEEIVVLGDDLEKIKANRQFARISFIEIDDVENEQALYNLIRKIEYVKYHYFPQGYMIRTSSRSHKEVVRVSKKSIKNGIDFKKVGSLLISKYKEIPGVKNVKVVFVTDLTADYTRFSSIAEKNNAITETLNHVMNTVNFDCSTCNLKPICDEVEGMKELHFKSRSEKM